MGLRLIRWQSTWMEGIYWCRVVPTNVWAKITYKNLTLTMWNFLLGYHFMSWEAIPSVAQMYEPNLEADIFHI